MPELPIAERQRIHALLHPRRQEVEELLAGGVSLRRVQALYPLEYIEISDALTSGHLALDVLLLTWLKADEQFMQVSDLVERLTEGYKPSHEFMRIQSALTARRILLQKTGRAAGVRYGKQQNLILIVLWACDHPGEFLQLSTREEQLLAEIACDAVVALEAAVLAEASPS